MKKRLPVLTGGLNELTRADIIDDAETTTCDNLEIVFNGKLTIRKDVETYDSDLQSLLDIIFPSGVLKISEPFYPPNKPADMAGDFLLLVYGKPTASTYMLHVFYQSDAGWIAGDNLVSNGGFDDSSAWTIPPTDWEVSSGHANHHDTGINDLEQDIGLANSSSYVTAFELVSVTGGSGITIKLHTQAGTYRSSAGYYAEVITSNGTGTLKFTPDSNDDMSIDNVRVWRYDGYFTQSLTEAGISYTSDSDMLFFIGSNRVIITDNINQAHYVTVDADGNIVTGLMGIDAPLNKIDMDDLTGYSNNDWDHNVNNVHFGTPGLVQLVYTVKTESGDESNPSPLSLTRDMQLFKLDTTDYTDERWIDKVPIYNLSVPENLGADIKDSLKYFSIYGRIIRNSEGTIPATFGHIVDYEIVDKETTSGTTGNYYTLVTPVDNTQQISYENDVAPISKTAAEVAGVAMLGNITKSVDFPFNFDYFIPIKLSNNDSETYIDAIIRLRLYDENSSDSNKITNLDWSDFDTDADDYIEGLDKLRIYDDDLTTALPVVYRMDTSAKWCDIWVRIPQFTGGAVHTIYFAFAPTSKGVNNANFQTYEYGEWLGVDDPAVTWTDQKVFYGERVKENSIVCSPMDLATISTASNEIYNKYDWNNNASLPTSSYSTSGIAKIGVFNKVVGDASVNLGNGRNISYNSLTITDTPTTGYAYFRIKYDGNSYTANAGVVKKWFSFKSGGTFRLALGVDSNAGGTNYWTVTHGATDVHLTNIPEFDTAAGNHEYFVLFSWDGDNNNVSAFVADMSAGTIVGAEELGVVWTTSIDGIAFSDSDATVITIISFAEVNVIQGRYFSATDMDDFNTVFSMFNFMPAFQNIPGYRRFSSNNQLIPDPTMDDPNDWTISQSGGPPPTDDWNVTGGVAHTVAAGTLTVYPNVLTIGEEYYLEFEIKNYVSGNCAALNGVNTLIQVSGDGAYNITFVAAATDLVFKSGGTPPDFDLDNAYCYGEGHNQ